MKKLLLTVFALSITIFTFAKKVKFAVDMTGQTISPNGIHVSGDFQKLAGYPEDWSSSATTLIQEPGTSIYSIVVNIPAFRKYEYKFVNGDQFYEVEFVPVESRVGYDFNDNRWLWVDSLANDTTHAGAILFGGNAPAGLKLIRFMVDLQNIIPVSPKSIHVAGSFQGWNPAKTMLYSFNDTIYEIINYVPAGNYEFKYYNGNVSGTAETVPSSCAVNGNRIIQVNGDTILAPICFAKCTSCSPTGIFENNKTIQVTLFPNPAGTYATLKLNEDMKQYTISVADIAGRIVRTYAGIHAVNLHIDKGNLPSGVYFIRIATDNKVYAAKLTFE